MLVEEDFQVALCSTAQRNFLQVLGVHLGRQTVDQVLQRSRIARPGRQRVAGVDDAGRPVCDLLREYRHHAGQDHRVQQESQRNTGPAMHGHERPGVGLTQPDHRVCLPDSAQGADAGQPVRVNEYGN